MMAELSVKLHLPEILAVKVGSFHSRMNEVPVVTWVIMVENPTLFVASCGNLKKPAWTTLARQTWAGFAGVLAFRSAPSTEDAIEMRKRTTKMEVIFIGLCLKEMIIR